MAGLGMMSLTADAQMDVLVEEVVEGMPSLCELSSTTRPMGSQKSTSFTTDHPPQPPQFDQHMTLTLRVQPYMPGLISREVRAIFYMITLVVFVHLDLTASPVCLLYYPFDRQPHADTQGD